MLSKKLIKLAQSLIKISNVGIGGTLGAFNLRPFLKDFENETGVILNGKSPMVDLSTISHRPNGSVTLIFNDGGYYLSTLSDYDNIIKHLQEAHNEIGVDFNKTMFDKTLSALALATYIAYDHFNENKDKVSSFKKMARLSHEETLQQANSKGWKPAKKTVAKLH